MGAPFPLRKNTIPPHGKLLFNSPPLRPRYERLRLIIKAAMPAMNTGIAAIKKT
jgi:hypothetical protein